MPSVQYYTADMVRAFPDDGNQYETVHGELFVTPAPRIAHERAASRLVRALGQYLDSTSVEGPFTKGDISWGPDNLVQPDIFVVDSDELQRAEKWSDFTILPLVIEVLSPSSVRGDRFAKRRLYQEHNVPTYWIVDIEHRQIEVWTPEALFPIVALDRIAWTHPAIAAPCVIELTELFAGL